MRFSVDSKLWTLSYLGHPLTSLSDDKGSYKMHSCSLLQSIQLITFSKCLSHINQNQIQVNVSYWKVTPHLSFNQQLLNSSSIQIYSR